MSDPQMTDSLARVERREQRKSMFVMATLYAVTGSAPVKVRDMSAAGALVEGAVIPAPGSKVRLSRGSLSVTGSIAWCKGARAGLSFDSTVSPDDWLPTGTPAPQQRVDELVQHIKSSIAGGLPEASPLLPQSPFVTAIEVDTVRHAIEDLADDLADDPDVIARHAEKLSTLDLAAQVLKKLAAELR